MKFLLPFVALCAIILGEVESVTKHTWVCENKRCIRKFKGENVTGVPLAICKLTCDDLANLWPKPTGTIMLGKTLFSIDPRSATLANLNDNPENIRLFLTTAFEIFKGYLPKDVEETSNNTLVISLNISSNTTDIDLGMDESYNLTVALSENQVPQVNAVIRAVTFFGARHALETLSQLIAYDNEINSTRIINNVTITDKPVFRYRGVMLDTSRNYFSMAKLKKLIDGMSYNKLNVFHWHITDSYAFPMEVPSLPQMTTYGAYSPEKIYTTENMKDLVGYARQRGIKVIPEIDQPAHSGYGYQWGKEDGLGNLVVCVESEPWYDFCVQPPCGQLNIVNDNVTQVVGQIFSDMLNVFDKDIFHMGGDEVDLRCYNSTKEITDWMNSNNYNTSVTENFYRLLSDFQEKLLGKLLAATKNNNTDVILWTSHLTDPERIEKYLDKKRYILQIWSSGEDPMIGQLLEKGYRAIFSNVNALYLDCGFQAWLGDGHNWCSPIKGWQTVYDNDPQKIYANMTNAAAAEEAVKSGQIMGSETPLWAEQADDNALESRIFPRAAAHAERLWTHPTTSHADAEVRMITNRDRIAARGILADRLQPEFCLQFEGKCYGEVRNDPPPPPPKEDGGGTSAVSLNSPNFVSIMLSFLAVFVAKF